MVLNSRQFCEAPALSKIQFDDIRQKIWVLRTLLQLLLVLFLIGRSELNLVIEGILSGFLVAGVNVIRTQVAHDKGVFGKVDHLEFSSVR